MEKAVLNISEAAELLNQSERTIRQWVDTKVIPYHKIGGKLLFNRHELMKLVGGEVNKLGDPVVDWLLEQIEQRRKGLQA